jgi:molecular chaperone GrpE (heat shock protein)
LQLNALSKCGDCHNQENPLKTIADFVTAKNLELEAKLAQMTEKALYDAAEFQKFKETLEKKVQKIIEDPLPKLTGPELLSSIV